MAFLIFSGDDYYPGGGWSDHDRTCETMEEARLATMKLRGDWLHIVDTATGAKTDYRWAKNQWMTAEDAVAWQAEEAAKAKAEFDRTHVKLSPLQPWCLDCKIDIDGSWCSCGKYASAEGRN